MSLKKREFMQTKLALLFSFVLLCGSSVIGAQTGVTMLVKTDIGCKWDLDGQHMGQLSADESKIVLVSPGEHIIEATTSDGVAKTRITVAIDNVEKTADIQLKVRYEQLKLQQAEASRIRPGTAQNPTWTDSDTGLMWTSRDNGSDVDWPQAKAYCSDLRLSGYSDWRLPTLDELQGIYDSSVSTRRLFGDGLTHDVHVKGNLLLTGRIWSSLQGDAPGMPYQWAWHFGFGAEPSSNFDIPKPRQNFLHFSWDQRALCVRRPTA